MFGETAAEEVRLVTGDCWYSSHVVTNSSESGGWRKPYLIVTILELLSQILADLSC